MSSDDSSGGRPISAILTEDSTSGTESAAIGAGLAAPDVPRLDPSVFLPSATLVALTGAGLILWPEGARETAEVAMNWVTATFGWLFVLTVAGAIVFCIWLAFGRYGNVKLGRPEDAPEYGELSWASMMFSAGIGIGLISWAFIEPIYYLTAPPMGLTPNTPLAAEWAHMYAMFHWGLAPWAIYAIPAVPIAYSLYVHERPFLRISVACKDTLRPVRFLEPVVDTLVIVGIIGGAGTSLGLGVPLVAEFTRALFGLEGGPGLQFGVLAFWTLLFSVSVYRGLKAGIQWLADANMLLAIVIALLVLVSAPTIFVLSLSANSLGLMLDNFIRMSFWLDPVAHGGFPEAWTIFYWAWWIAFAPLMGLFFGRISRGRTIRRTVLGIMLWGSAGCMSFMAICGGYALHLQLEGLLPVASMLAEHGAPVTVRAIIETLPLPGVALAAFTVLSFIFLATTLDSVAYVLASITTRDLPGDQEPSRVNRLTWAFALAFIAVGLLMVGGLNTVQSSSIVTALPLIPVLFLLPWALLQSLQADFGATLRAPILALGPGVDGERDVVVLRDPPSAPRLP